MATAVAKYSSQLWLSIRHSCGQDERVGGSAGRIGAKALGNSVITHKKRLQNEGNGSEAFFHLLARLFTFDLSSLRLLSFLPKPMKEDVRPMSVRDIRRRGEP